MTSDLSSDPLEAANSATALNYKQYIKQIKEAPPHLNVMCPIPLSNFSENTYALLL